MYTNALVFLNKIFLMGITLFQCFITVKFLCYLLYLQFLKLGFRYLARRLFRECLDHCGFEIEIMFAFLFLSVSRLVHRNYIFDYFGVRIFFLQYETQEYLSLSRLQDFISVETANMFSVAVFVRSKKLVSPIFCLDFLIIISLVWLNSKYQLVS